MGSFDVFGGFNDYAAVGPGIDRGCVGDGGDGADNAAVKAKMNIKKSEAMEMV